MKKKLLSLVLAGLTCMLAAATASATSFAPDSLDVDFRDNSWGSGAGENTYTVIGSGVTVTANTAQTLYYSSVDGFGIYGGENDEIDMSEWLSVGIDSGMYLDGAWLSDLFEYNDNYEGAEWGYLLLNGTTQVDFSASGTDNYAGLDESVDNGETFVAFNFDSLITSIDFYPGLGRANDAKNEYSVIGFVASPVPEPTTMLLFGTGLLGFTCLRRKVKK